MISPGGRTKPAVNADCMLQIDYLVNNIGQSQRADAIATELAVDRAIMDLNVLGTISLTKAVLPRMAEHREGCIVVISSVAGKIG